MNSIDKQIYKKVFNISLPAVGGFLGLILFDIIDIFWIEKLGTQAIAGVASAGFIVWTLYAFMQITSAGCASLVARFYGANKRRRAWEVIKQSSWLSFFISVLTFALFLPHIQKPFEWMGLAPEATELAVSYFTVILCGFPIIYLDMLSGNIFNAYSDNKVSNLIMICCLGLNIVLDPILMFGWLGMPALSTAGAAWATVISHSVSLLLRTTILLRRKYIPPLYSFLRFRTFYYSSIIKIGLPNATTGCVWSLVYPFLTRLITPFGMAPLSAIGICHRLESFPYFTATAFGIAMTSLVGQAVGKRETQMIDRTVTTGMKVSAIVMSPFIVLFLFFPHQLMSLMTDDPTLIKLGAEYLFIVGLLEVFMGWEMVMGGVFTGLGMTYPTLLITIPFTIGRIPAAWFFAYYLGMGVTGIWWAISISTFAKGFGLYVLYRFVKNRHA